MTLIKYKGRLNCHFGFLGDCDNKANWEIKETKRLFLTVTNGGKNYGKKTKQEICIN